MKNSNDIIGNRTRHLPAYSAVPQPTESYNVLDIICRAKVIVGQLLDNRSALHLASLDNEYLPSEEPCVYAVTDVGLTNTFLTCIIYIISSTL